jgi:hypothetical protein
MLRFVRTGSASANRAARPECVADQQSTGADVTTRAVVIYRRTRVGLASWRLAGLLGIVGGMRLIAPP